ncbi:MULTISPECIES: DUF3618 domain-containing protein [unclassified Streptomyces]|uniref:DUF3618 domain-containing protein n=1 Tax=unclassified Streptomyces TaxID=2593676 RepID=UPI00093A72F4|nr:DUF3618 domain-containing protein [Streptomyces sp. CB01883]OKJ82919.1 circumsporozoite protein [Streptomyces sp. CB01883]
MTHRTPHGSGAKGPDELRQQIEQTRHQLGDTVAQLMEKADVKGRARARAADLRDKAGAMTVQLRASAAHAGHDMQDKAARAGHAVQGGAAKAGHAVQGTAAKAGHAMQGSAAKAGHAVQGRAAGAGHSLEGSVPQPLRGALRRGVRHPGPVIAVGVLGAAAVAAGIAWRRQHHR